jgi:hypothetical protein
MPTTVGFLEELEAGRDELQLGLLELRANAAAATGARTA